MSNLGDLQRAIDHAFRGRLKTPRTWPALLGDVDGVVDTPNRAGWVNVVMPDGSSASAYNGGRVPPVAGLPVVVGYDYLNPALFAVLAVRQSYQDGTPYPAGIGAHAATHEWLQPNGGYDVVYADARQLLPLRLDVAGMVVTVHAGYAMTETGWTLAAGQSVDLTASIPGSGAKWALITLDEAGALTATLGSDGGSRLLLGPGQLPALPDHHRPLAGVKLYAGQTEIVESLTQQDLVDLRFAAPYTVAPVPTVDAIQFDTAAGVTPAEGEAAWDADAGTLAIGMPGGDVTLQLGQEQLVRVQNDSGGALADGDLVYVSGASGTNIKVKKAKADAESTSATTIGMATEAIASNQHGYIATFGVVHGLNTSGSAAGSILYLSPTTAGGWTTTKPTAPNHTVTVGVIVRENASAGEIFISINNGYELDELHDVAISGSAAGDLLIASSAGTWANHPLTGDASLTSGGALTIANGAITFAKMAPLTGLSVIGTAGSATATPEALTAGSAGQVLRRASSGSTLAFGAVDLASANAITGVLPVANGGTGGSSLAAAGLTSGSGTAAYVARWTDANTLGNSVIRDNGSTLGIGSAPASNTILSMGGTLASSTTSQQQAVNIVPTISPVGASLSSLYGQIFNPQLAASSAPITVYYGQLVRPDIRAGYNSTVAYRVAQAVGLGNITSGSVTYQAGLTIAEQTGATNNTALMIGSLLPNAGQWSIYNAGAQASYFKASLLLGTLTPPSSGSPALVIGRAASSPTGLAADTAAFYMADRNGVAGRTWPHIATEDGITSPIQLTSESSIFSNPLFYAPFDGPAPHETDYTGNIHGVFGQPGTILGGVTFRPGKFGKALQAGAATTNLFTDPSFENATLTNWTASGTLATNERSAEYVYIGSYARKLVNASGSAAYLYAPVSVSASAHALSVRVRLSTGAAVSAASVALLFDSADAAPVYTALDNGWWLLTYAATPTAGARNFGVKITSGYTAYLDAAQLEALSAMSPYCDGSLGAGHSWSGTAHASASSRTLAGTYYTTGKNIRASAGTISFWVFVVPMATAHYFFRCNATTDLSIFRDAVSSGRFVFYAGGAAVVVQNFNNYSGWTHVVCTWDVNSGKFVYLNGGLAGSGAAPSAVNLGSIFYVGTYDSLTNIYQCNGPIDEFAIFDRALTAAEISELYYSNRPLPVSRLGVEKVTAVSANYTALATDDVIACTAGSAGITITLPPAASCGGNQCPRSKLTIKKTDLSGGYVTVDGNGSETIDGDLTKVIAGQWNSMTIYSDGTQWLIG